MDTAKNVPTETDTAPRTSARDLFMVLDLFERRPEQTLEEIRLRICVDRKKQWRGTALYTAARDASAELVKLGLISGACHARNTRQYQAMKANRLSITAEGTKLLALFRKDRASAYDDLFRRLVAQHPYVREIIRALARRDILAPVISSMRDHVSGALLELYLPCERRGRGQV